MNLDVAVTANDHLPARYFAKRGGILGQFGVSYRAVG
jgi:hypothetical protein